MSKESTRAALNKFCARDAKKLSRQKRTNQKPEFKFQSEILIPHLIKMGFDIDVVQSKAVYNFAAGRYDHGQAEAGFSDLSGVTPYHGVGCWIEVKAPGSRNRLELHQKHFLMRKIKMGAFACCTDSIQNIEQTFFEWVKLRSELEPEKAMLFLTNALPMVKELTDKLDDIFKD